MAAAKKSPAHKRLAPTTATNHNKTDAKRTASKRETPSVVETTAELPAVAECSIPEGEPQTPNAADNSGAAVETATTPDCKVMPLSPGQGINDFLMSELSREQMSSFLETGVLPFEISGVTARPALSPEFAGLVSATSANEVAAGDDPVWRAANAAIWKTLDVITERCEVTDDAASIAIQWLEQLKYELPIGSGEPFARLRQWICEDVDRQEVAANWMHVGAADSCCKLLFSIRQLKRAGLGDRPTVGPDWLVFDLFDSRYPKSFVYPECYERICQEWLNLEVLVNHSCRHIGVGQFPSTLFQPPETVDGIKAQGGAPAVMKEWTGAVCHDSEAWQWVYSKLKSYFARQLEVIERSLMNALVCRGEVPIGWEPGAGDAYPCFPPITPPFLAHHVKKVRDWYVSPITRGAGPSIACLLPDACRELRNVRRSFSSPPFRSLGLELPSGFTDSPSDMNDAEKQLESVLNVLNPAPIKPTATTSDEDAKPMGATGKTTKRKRGRPKGAVANDPKRDKKIAEAWAKGHGQYASQEALAGELRIDKAEVVAALDRHRKRLAKPETIVVEKHCQGR